MLDMHAVNKKTAPVRSSSHSLGRNEADALMYQERCGLVTKWFSKWNTAQRTALLQQLIDDCSQHEQEFLHERTRRRVPRLRVDLAEALPRRLSLKILSYLDPRSLCRSAQVNWHWNWLCESNELWLPKCNRQRWLLSAQAHGDIEQTMRWTGRKFPAGIYKRLYWENLASLQTDGSALAERERLLETARRQDAAAERERRALLETARQRRLPLTQPVWRLSGKAEDVTRRFNVLENQDIQRMDARRRDPEPRNTMRSVVLVPSGKPKPPAAATARSPERPELLARSTRLLNTARPLSESTTQTQAELWQAAAAASAAAASPEDDKEKKKKDKKKKKKKSENDSEQKSATEDADDGEEKKKKKKKDDKDFGEGRKKKKKSDDDEDSAAGDSEEDHKKKEKKKKKKKDTKDGKDKTVESDEEKKKKKEKEAEEWDRKETRRLDLRDADAGRGDGTLLTPDT